MKKIFIKMIDIYRKFISPILGNNCRFYPACSEYAQISIDKYGIIKGLFKAFVRILRCNPFCSGGTDLP